MNLAPIALFVYNRPWHTEQTLNALTSNELAQESILFIYADGPKTDASKDDLEKIINTRNVIRKKQWCKEVHIVESETNNGLAASIINGVTEIINKYGKIIVLEDDLITSPFFLQYCNEGLQTYKNTSNVYSINAFQFPIQITKTDTFLSPLGMSSWGWATWADKWKAFDTTLEYKDIIFKNDYIRNRFDFAGNNRTEMLNNTNSWAIKWYYSVFIKNGLGVFSTKSLVHNIGFDGTGVNYTKNVQNTIEQNIYNEPVIIQLKDFINLEYIAAVIEYFKEQRKKSSSSRSQNIFTKFLRYFN